MRACIQLQRSRTSVGWAYTSLQVTLCKTSALNGEGDGIYSMVGLYSEFYGTCVTALYDYLVELLQSTVGKYSYTHAFRHCLDLPQSGSAFKKIHIHVKHNMVTHKIVKPECILFFKTMS